MRFLFRPNDLLFIKILSKGKILVRLQRMTSAPHRQNLSEECETAINKQINLELKSSYAYLAMAYHCHNVALTGGYKFFKEASADEQKHAEQFMEYLSKRGGRIVLTDIAAPKTEYKTLLETLVEALNMEMTVNEALLELHEIASKANDPNLSDFIEGNFLQEQVDAQKQLTDYIQQLERAETNFGSYFFDRRLAKDAKMH